jgi:hypothetical protein
MVLKRVDFSSITSEDLEELGAKRKLLPWWIVVCRLSLQARSWTKTDV